MAWSYSGDYRNYYGVSGEKKTGRKGNCLSGFYLLDYWDNFVFADVCGVCCLRRGNGIIIIEVDLEGMYFASPLIDFLKSMEKEI